MYVLQFFVANTHFICLKYRASTLYSIYLCSYIYTSQRLYKINHLSYTLSSQYTATITTTYDACRLRAEYSRCVPFVFENICIWKVINIHIRLRSTTNGILSSKHVCAFEYNKNIRCCSKWTCLRWKNMLRSCKVDVKLT